MPSPSQLVVCLFPIVTLALILIFFCYAWQARRTLPEGDPLAWVRRSQEQGSGSFSLAGRLYPMERGDALPVLLITAVYALTAFFHLGSLSAPQQRLTFEGPATAFWSLDQPVEVGGVGWYSGLGTGSFSLDVSLDGVSWQHLTPQEQYSTDGGSTWLNGKPEAGTSARKRTAYSWLDAEAAPSTISIRQNHNSLFKWFHITTEEGKPAQARYFRLAAASSRYPLEMAELVLYDPEGRVIPVEPRQAVITPADGITVPDADLSPLFDEQALVPEHSTYYDSTYFDEIYHPRTALEHLRGIYPYEISHPPLGKEIMSLGIRMFGMTPFGWRFMGTLFGVLMLPLLYIFLKNMFGRTLVAACGTILFAADFMHLTQTRIGTIDTYGVFFILLMYYFMYRYLALPAGSSFGKCAVPLFFSGLFWGIGAASKWTVIYGCVGLVVLYFLGLWIKLRDWPDSRCGKGRWAVSILLFSVLVFALIPAAIYTASYLPYAQASGDTSLRGIIDAMWNNQVYMLTYHQGVTTPHPYSSRWYQWMLDIRPILYYLDTSVPGMETSFGAFSNPVVCWGGLLALAVALTQVFRRRCGQALFLLVGYLSQLVPWCFIGRTTFEYHYFPSILFLVMALAYVFNDLALRQPAHWKRAVYAMTGGAVALYALFYPVLVGIPIPTWYGSTFLKWLPSWPF